jgi:hypothetical protein
MEHDGRRAAGEERDSAAPVFTTAFISSGRWRPASGSSGLAARASRTPEAAVIARPANAVVGSPAWPASPSSPKKSSAVGGCKRESDRAAAAVDMHRVVTMAASGLTNKRIAQTLFHTVKTV